MRHATRILTICFLFSACLALSGCFRERPSENQPIHLITNMDSQQKYKAYGKSDFFKDHSNMRTPVAGTVARGELEEDTVFYQGKTEGGRFVRKSPVSLSREVLAKGQQRYKIYCTPCHGAIGDGKGVVIQYGFAPATSFHEDRILKSEDGYLFDVITNGIRNMPSYSHQVPAKDRWAIVHYVRALQRSQNARLRDIPEQVRSNLK